MKIPIPVPCLGFVLAEDKKRILKRLLDWSLILDLVDEVNEVDFSVALNLAGEVSSESVGLAYDEDAEKRNMGLSL